MNSLRLPEVVLSLTGPLPALTGRTGTAKKQLKPVQSGAPEPTALAFVQTLPQTQSKYKHYSLTVTWFLVHNQVSGMLNRAVNPATQSSGFMLPGLHLVGWASSKLRFANVNTDERKHLV